jgi:hypothetical protein
MDCFWSKNSKEQKKYLLHSAKATGFLSNQVYLTTMILAVEHPTFLFSTFKKESFGVVFMLFPFLEILREILNKIFFPGRRNSSVSEHYGGLEILLPDCERYQTSRMRKNADARYPHIS